jgi:hypothetical protein|tara:strand:- start:3889 stop:4749 length:861 start_codon:yes stop_codon:yes gene_type:complete
MKSSKKKLSPDDAELRKSVKPVICYPTDSLKSPNMNDYLIARKNLKKIDQIIIPPRDAKCFRVPKSHFFRIYCQNGPQVGDLNLWNEHNLNEKFYSGKTRALYGTHLSTNDRLWSSLPYLRPMATITHDTLDWYGFDDDGGSVHDVIGTRCDPYTEKILSNKEYHFCCHSNLIRALSNYKNISYKEAENYIHDVLNVFMCTGFTKDTHQYFMKASPVRIGDYIEFFSEIDLLAGLSACPGGDCSLSHSSDDAVCYSLKVEIYECLNNDLKNWREPETSNYSGDHKN